MQFTENVADFSKMLEIKELLSFIDDLANEIEEGEPIEEGLCIGSLDVVSLYPSLDISQCAKICGEEIRASNLRFEEVNM